MFRVARLTRLAGVAVVAVTAVLASTAPFAAAGQPHPAGHRPTDAPPVAGDLVPNQGVLFGAGLPTTGSGQLTEATLSEQEDMLSRKLDLHRVYRLWDDAEPDTVLRTDVQRGRTPILSIKPKYGSGRQVSWASIARGDQDATIANQADGLKTLTAPVYLSFHHEADLAGNASYGTAAEYVAAWRHYRQVFAARGARNVAFTWIVTTSTFSKPGVTDSFYPGDDVVDWIALDAFNWFGCLPGQATKLALAGADHRAVRGLGGPPRQAADAGRVGIGRGSGAARPQGRLDPGRAGAGEVLAAAQGDVVSGRARHLPVVDRLDRLGG